MEKIEIINKLYKLCLKAYKRNEVPVGAIIIRNNKIIAQTYNKKNIKNISFYHAEILAIIKASKRLKTWNLSECELYVSLEPCNMCKNIINESRIKKVYFCSKSNYKNKFYDSQYEHMFAINGNGNKFDEIMKNFFKMLR